VIAVLKLSLEEGTDSFGEMSAIFFLCYSFLKKFCEGNKVNQKALSVYTDFMLEQHLRHSHITNIMDTIIEIYRDNGTLCERLCHNESIVRNMGRLVDGDNIKGLEFLKTVVSPGAARANQNVVLRKLLGLRTDIALRERVKRPMGSLPPKSQWHIEYVILLSLCVAGKNQGAKDICQKLLSVDKAVESLYNAQDSPMLEAAYAKFLDEVYLGTDNNNMNTQMLGIRNNDMLWKSIEEVGYKLQFIAEEGKRNNGHTSVISKTYVFYICSFFGEFLWKILSVG